MHINLWPANTALVTISLRTSSSAPKIERGYLNDDMEAAMLLEAIFARGQHNFNKSEIQHCLPVGRCGT
jgi:hypothetical protein